MNAAGVSLNIVTINKKQNFLKKEETSLKGESILDHPADFCREMRDITKSLSSLKRLKFQFKEKGHSLLVDTVISSIKDPLDDIGGIYRML